jgi:two-component system sensor histidine kinase/response regulator
MNATAVESGASALKAIAAASSADHPFSIVLVDAQMPGMDGFELVKEIHRQPGPAVPVILMLSSDRLLGDRAQCQDLGVKVFLTKPVGQSELLDAVIVALGIPTVETLSTHLPSLIKEKSMRRNLTILLAEDNPVNQKLAIRLLEKTGCQVITASNGREALNQLQQSRPVPFDLVLMDIQMPEMDGLEATAAIRDAEKSSGRHLPIIAMTANAMRGDRERYLGGGMDGYISKPIDPRGLFAEIDRCLAGIIKSAPMTEKLFEPGDQVDRVSLLDRVEGDQELLAEIIQVFLADAPQLLVAMQNALQQGDMILLERTAHSMKGAAGNMSALAAVNAASELEQSAKKKDAESSISNLAALQGAVERLLPVLADLCQEVSK